MKLLTYVRHITARKRKHVPNSQPFMLWTAETQEWRPIVRKEDSNGSNQVR
jgi:hypothetical protein